MTASEQVEKSELMVSRAFDAPRNEVFKAFTEPDLVKQWYGPKGFTAPVIEAELRPGGRYLYCMESADGRDYWSAGVYREFKPPERIVAIDSFADEEGNIVTASYYGMSAEWPLESVVTVTFDETEGGTILTIRQSGVPGGTELDNSIVGWNQSLDKLQALLEGGTGRCRERVRGGERREED